MRHGAILPFRHEIRVGAAIFSIYSPISLAAVDVCSEQTHGPSRQVGCSQSFSDVPLPEVPDQIHMTTRSKTSS